jgi:hypothetical protein
MWPPPLLRLPRSSSGRGRRAWQVAGDCDADVAGVHTSRSALAGSWIRALAERVMRPSEPLVHSCLRAPKAGAASAHVPALTAARAQRQGCGMLWFFAVAAAIGAALWGAVRIEQGVGPVPVGDSGPGSAGEARRCRTRRRPPAGLCRKGCRELPGGRRPRMLHCDARSAVVHRGGEAGVRRHQRLSRCQPRPAGCPRTAARQRVSTRPGT